MLLLEIIVGCLLVVFAALLLISPKAMTSSDLFWKFCFHDNIKRIPGWKKFLVLKGTGTVLLGFALMAFYVAAKL